MCNRCNGQFGVCDCVTCRRCGVLFQVEPGEATEHCMGCLEELKAADDEAEPEELFL